MDLPWLEDFLSLSVTLNFSRAAQLRNLTQPTFSRRIQNLEAWLGTTLVDRSTVPVSLTEDGRRFRIVAERVVQSLHEERDSIRYAQHEKMSFISFTMLQNVAISFYPAWLESVEARSGPLKTRVVCANQHDCVQELDAGSCDFYISYFHESALLQLDSEKYASVALARERLLPVSAPGVNGMPRHSLDDSGDDPVAYLDHPPHTFTAKLIDHLFVTNADAPTLDTRHENALSAGLKALALEGAGLVWLPERLALPELSSGALVIAGGTRWILPMEIRAYRLRGEVRREVERVWSLLTSKHLLNDSI